jgi:KipI family sensor histidine kinase inhibitor
VPTTRLEVRPYGDTGVLAGVLGEDYETRWSTTQALAGSLRRASPAWLVDLVATYDHVFVTFDPETGDHDAASALLERLHRDQQPGDAPSGRTLRVPVLFGGEAGPDLEDVATELGLTTDALVERVCASPWTVRFVAGPVGTPFTDRDDWDAAIPRMRVPRVAVPPGSVALSGAQSIIYPVRSPGGWRLLGRTPLPLLAADPDSQELVAYGAGDRLQHEPVDLARYDELRASGARLGVDA